MIFRTRPTHSAAMATLCRQLQLMALAESPPAHFRVSPTGVRSILPCTVKLQFGVNKVRKRGSVQNRRDALFRTGSVGGAAELVTCERERSNRRARGQLCGCGFRAFRSALRSHAGSERYASAGATGPGVSSISGIGNVLNPPPYGFGVLDQWGEPAGPGRGGPIWMRRHPAAAAESSCPNMPAISTPPRYSRLYFAGL